MSDGTPRPSRLAVVGAGWIGSFHAETIANRVPGALLAAVADPRPAAAEGLTTRLGGATATQDANDVFAMDDVDGVVIASPAHTHTDLVVAAAEAGKAIFVEKPMALTLAEADRAITAARAAGVPLQTGFNRRFARGFAEARSTIAAGGIGTPQLMRSLTRDPGIPNPAGVKSGTIFLETLIHDFDTLNWCNPDAHAVEVFATADALAYPEFKEAGLLDTAIVTIRYSNGALANAEASFHAVYGYDVRGEFFGSAGMVTAGGYEISNMRRYAATGGSMSTVRSNIELFHQAYTDELVSFAHSVASGNVVQGAIGGDARAALAIALACIESVERRAPVQLTKDGSVEG